MSVKLAYLRGFFITGAGFLCIIIVGIVLVIITQMAGSIHFGSEKFQTFTKKQGQRNKLTRRIVTALKLIAVKNGGYHEIKIVTSLTPLGMIVNIPGSVLLSFNK